MAAHVGDFVRKVVMKIFIVFFLTVCSLSNSFGQTNQTEISETNRSWPEAQTDRRCSSSSQTGLPGSAKSDL
jgi:hypothetical protein